MSDASSTLAASAAGVPSTGRSEARQKGHLRFDRRFGALGVPRLQITSGTHDHEEFRRLNEALTVIAGDAVRGGSILQAFAKGLLTTDDLLYAASGERPRAHVAATATGELEDAARRDAAIADPLSAAHASVGPKPGQVMADEEPRDLIAHIRGPRPRDVDLIERPLWQTILEVIGSSEDLEAETRKRYTTSVKALRRKASAFAMSDDVHQELANISESEWSALEAFRRRGVTVDQLAEIVALPRPVRAQYLRQLGVRIGADLTTRLEGLPGAVWDALHQAGDHPVGWTMYEQLDGMSPRDRARLRIAVEHLGPEATVADLVRMDPADWQLIADSWGASGADWMHVRRMLQSVLTRLFHGNTRHPIRRHVIDNVPTQPVRERVPELQPDKIWAILDKLTPHARGFPLVLVVTGLRIGEYEALEPRHLNHVDCIIDVPGTKTDASADRISVAPDMWPAVVAAVPSAFRYGWMRRLFKQACAEAGVEGITLHDLRHCHAQWALDNGAEERAVQRQLRHTSIGMTRRYTVKQDTSGVAQAVAAHVRAHKPAG